jgi:PAS domain S-box-containing protein
LPPHEEGEAVLRPWRFTRLLVAAVVITNLAAFLLGAFSLHDSHQRAEELASQTTRNLVQVLDESLARSGKTIDVTLRAVVEELEREERDAQGGPSRDEAVLAMLARYKNWLPEAEGIRVFDEYGKARWTSRSGPSAGITVADREFFIALRANPLHGLYVSRPVAGRIVKGWVMPFVRRFNHPDGSFAGVVSAIVPLSTITEALARPQLGSGGSAILRYEDSSLVTRYPPVDGPAGEIGAKAYSEQFRSLMAAGQASATYYASNTSDGLARINSYRRVEGLPFTLVVGMARDEYLKAWRREFVQTALLLTIFLLATSGSAALIGRLYRRQQHNNERLEESKRDLEAILVDLRDRDRVLGAAEQIGGLGVYSVDLASGASRGTPQLRAIFGVGADESFDLQGWIALIHPDDRKRVTEQFMDDLLGKGRVFDCTYRVVRPDGELRWVHGIGGLSRDAAGQAVSVHGAVQDITERTNAEASLQEALDEHEKLVARIPVGVFKQKVGRDGRMDFVYVSPRFCEQLGLSVEAVLADARTVLRCIHPDDTADFAARCRSVLNNPGPFAWEGRVLVGGMPRWVSVLSTPTILGNGELLWEGVQSDVTDRKLAEIALRESEERYRLLLQHSPVGILHFGNDLKVSYCNLQFAQIMHAPHAYMLTLDCSTLKDQCVLPAMRAALEGRFGEYAGPYKTSYAGQELNIAMNCAPVRDEVGGIVGGIAILQDISERVQKDRELTRYRDSLEELVAERTADLEAARAEAERLARVKSEFLANMSHEIRTPLNGVLGLAHIGFRESKGRDKAQDTFARIVSSGQLLLGIINDILDFSKIEAGKVRVEVIPVDPGRVIGETLELMEERAEAKGLVLRFLRLSPLPRHCLADPLRIGQVLLNLLSNAIKFTEEGSVTLCAGYDNGQLVFQVSDTGIGMSANEIAKVFAPFEQADNSITRKFGGTGLGLTITHRIVELMGGTLRAQSEPGQGSMFEVRLPSAEVNVAENIPGEARPADVPQGAPGARLAGYRVLVAEDNEVNQMVLEELLLDEGALVTLTGNGQEAVDCLRARGAEAFQVVLMDVQMPVLDGYAATREIHALAPDLPVIGQTAHAFDEERALCFAAGMVAHLAKPIDPERMVKAILQYGLRPDVEVAGSNIVAPCLMSQSEFHNAGLPPVTQGGERRKENGS